MSTHTKVELTKYPVELFKILKFEGIADSGAEAKQMIADGEVMVNGSIELRKRRQINVGDIIQVQDQQLETIQAP